MRQADPTTARAAALKILADFPVRAVPVPVERIIKARNIVLQHAPLAEELSGMAYIKEGVAIIGVNALHHPNRQRFSAAHELAHHVLHVPEISAAVHVDKGFRVLHRDELAAKGTDPLEIDANAFCVRAAHASPILTGGGGRCGAGSRTDDAAIESLARKFKVSVSAMRNRLSGGWF